MKQKHRLIASILLLLTALLLITGCNSTPPVTDYASFMENLEQVGTTVEIKRQDTEASTFAALYLQNYRDAFESVLESGRTIDPGYYDQETSRLKEIEEKTGDFDVIYTDLTVNGEYIYVNEYGSEANARLDADYARLVDVPEFTVTVPTSSENVTFLISSERLGMPHYYRQGRIIVLFIETNPDSSQAMLDLMESLMGPEFHTL